MSTLTQPAPIAANGRSESRGADGLTFDTWTIVLGIFALGNLVNALWMLADPVHWYENLPAGVPDFGPLNEHFVRDIGCAFFVFGTGILASAFVARWRVAACGAAAAFFGLHAVVHVVDTMRGLVGPEHWLIDLPGVYVPALVLLGLTWMLARRHE